MFLLLFQVATHCVDFWGGSGGGVGSEYDFNTWQVLHRLESIFPAKNHAKSCDDYVLGVD